MIETARLCLRPSTIELVDADLTGSRALAAALSARVPASWPPDLYSREMLRQAREKLVGDPEQDSWWHHYMVWTEAEPVLIGVCGYRGPPKNGAVEIGFAVLPEFRRRGYATEAAMALIRRAFLRREVAVVLAHAVSKASAGVLLSCGFRQKDIVDRFLKCYYLVREKAYGMRKL